MQQGLSLPKGSVGLSLASRPFSQLSGLGGSALPNPLSCPQLWAVSLPGLWAAFARLAGSASPRRLREGVGGGGAEARRGRALSAPPTPQPPLSTGCWGRWQERRAPPAAGGEGWGKRKTGAPAWIRADRALQKGDGLCFPPAPWELQSGPRCPDCLAPLWDLAASARPPGGHDPSAVRGAPPGSPAACHRRRALDRYDGRSFSSADEGGSRGRSAGGHAGGVEGAASTLTFHWAEWEAPVGLMGRGIGRSVGT